MSIKIIAEGMTDKEAQDKFLEAQKYLRQSDLANFLLDELINSPYELTIRVSETGSDTYAPPKKEDKNSAGIVHWNINQTLTVKSDNTPITPALALMHEMGHACQFLTGEDGEFMSNVKKKGSTAEAEDINTTAIEKTVANELNAKGCKEGVRKEYQDHL